MVDGIHSIIENIEGIEDVLETKPEDIKHLHNNSSREATGRTTGPAKGQEQSRNDPLEGRPNSRGVRQISPQEQQEMKELEKQAEVLKMERKPRMD